MTTRRAEASNDTERQNANMRKCCAEARSAATPPMVEGSRARGNDAEP
jgi:hypothetical protein